MKKIFFMPMRKGSKSIPEKNRKSFCGKPLFCWYVEAILESGVADEIWLAIDCEQIESIAKAKYRNTVFLYRRKPENAEDTSPSLDVVLEFLHGKTYHPEDYFILVQATSPFTSIQDLQKLNKKIIEGEGDSYIACARMKKFRWSEDGKPLDYKIEVKPRRQDYKGFLVETGAFYGSRIGDILSTGKLISGRISVVELCKESLIDIDDALDWVTGEAYFQYLLNHTTNEKRILLGISAGM